MLFVIKVGSITNAQRGASVLRSRGYRPMLSRIENPTKNDGCGYVIKVTADDESKIIRLLKNAGVSILGVDIQ